MVSWKQLVMVVGVTFLFLGSSVIPQAESIESIERDSNLLDNVATNDALTDEIRDPHQSNDGFFLKHAFVWGTYEHRWKDYLLSFRIWNDDLSNLTIHVIGYGAYGPSDEYIWVHIEASYVESLRHLGIIGPHSCFIFAFSFLGVTVEGIRQ